LQGKQIEKEHRCFSQTLEDIQKEVGSKKHEQKVEETGVVLFIDQYRMKIMPQVSTITIEDKSLIPALKCILN
jgi:hypothetical protein